MLNISENVRKCERDNIFLLKCLTFAISNVKKNVFSFCPIGRKLFLVIGILAKEIMFSDL